jgi:hypothetical protein
VITATASTGCTASDSVVVTVFTPPTPVINPVGPTYFCQGDSATLTSQRPYSRYRWSSGDTTRSIVVKRAGTYTLTVTDSNGCTGSTSTNVIVNPLPTPTIASATEFCQGDTITMAGQPGYNRYQWSTGDTTRIIRVWRGGTYTLTVTNSNGCKGSVSQTVKVNALPTPTIASPAEFCQGDTITMVGQPGYNRYLWSTGDTTRTLLVWNAGTYTLTVTDSNGCRNTASQTVKVNPLPTPTIASATEFCQGDTITMAGQPGYNHYQWSTGDTSVTIEVRKGGTYTLTVTDSNGCRNTVSQTVKVNPLPTPTIASPAEFCQGDTITMVGKPGYSRYQWSTGDTTRTISIWKAGTYTLTVTDSNGCKNLVSKSVKVNPLPTPTIAYQPSFCLGENTTLVGEPGYVKYIWSTGDTGRSLTVNQGGTYTLTVIDGNGCKASVSATIKANEPPMPLISAQQSFCAGDSATLYAQPGYISYLWSTGATADSIVIRDPGTYMLTVIDSNGCTGSSTITIASLTVPGPIINGTKSFCQGDSTVLSVAKGYLSYRWSTGDTTESIVVHDAGTYTVTVVGSNLCSGSTGTTVTVNPLPEPMINGDFFFCNGDSTTLDAGPGYAHYQWSTGDTTRTIVVKQNDTVSVTVTNATGCSATSASVAAMKYDPPDPRISHLGPTVFCPGDSVILRAIDSTASYLWSTGEKSRSIVARDSGIYRLIVTSPNGCRDSSSIAVRISSHLEPEIAVVGPSGLCDGGTTVLDAGDGYAKYLWSTGDTTRTIVVDRPGSYSVSVASSGGCTGASAPVAITANPKPAVAITSMGSTSLCDGKSLVLQASGGFISYLWSTGDTTQSITANGLGEYTVTVTDVRGCQASDTITLTEAAKPSVSAGTDLTICPGGSAALLATGGVSYQWSPAQGLSCTDCADPVARPARTTTYIVEVTDEKGCQASDTVVVFVRSVPLLVKARIDNDYILNPGKNISIPVVLEDSTDGSRVHSFDISMRFDSTVLRLDNAGDHTMLFNTLCDGWKTEVLKDTPGEFAARLTAPDGRWLSGTGRLMNLEFTGFLGKAPASIVDFNIALNDAPCTEVLADAGKVRIEVCGISDRLIEMLPFGYELKQNHPNPFNPSTQIDFSIAFEDHVTLQVFDESGREVTRLVDGILQPGKYSVIFDATNFATGMYTYRFVAGSFVQTRQMTVVK